MSLTFVAILSWNVEAQVCESLPLSPSSRPGAGEVCLGGTLCKLNRRTLYEEYYDYNIV